MTQQNVTQLSFVPGSLIINKYDAKPYLVLSLPSLLRPLQQVVKAAPIERDLLAMKCKKSKTYYFTDYCKSKRNHLLASRENLELH